MTRQLQFLLGIVFMSCQTSPPTPWDHILKKDFPLFAEIINHPEKYEVQIIYTELKGDVEDPAFIRHEYRLDSTIYFYPASTVKMPTAFVALEKFQMLQEKYTDLSLDTKLVFDSIRPPQSAMQEDSCSVEGYPTFRSLLTQTFVISDNNTYNRLYEFVGQQELNNALYAKGVFKNSIIRTRVGVGGFDSLENQYSNPFSFFSPEGDTIYYQSGTRSSYSYTTALKNSVKGKGYYDDGLEKVIYEPFDFSQKNFISLADLDRSLKRIVYPQKYPPDKRFAINEENRQELLKMLKMRPSEVFCYADNPEHYYDSYVKFFLFGDKQEPYPRTIDISNKVGLAYGYLTDIAYIEDKENDIRFFLAATIHVNDNEIYNDGIYEYDSIGIPFLAELGRRVYAYELSKK